MKDDDDKPHQNVLPFGARTRHQEMLAQTRAHLTAHPDVWRWFCYFTLEEIATGAKHGSAKAMVEKVRWKTKEAKVDPSKKFKMDDSHTAFLARWFMQVYPQHEGFFRIRHQKSRDQPAIGLAPLGPPDFPYTTLKAEEDLP